MATKWRIPYEKIHYAENIYCRDRVISLDSGGTVDFCQQLFDRLYIKNINANIYSSLDEVTEDFHEAGSETYYRPFEEYSLSTGSPVLALRDDFKFADTGFLIN